MTIAMFRSLVALAVVAGSTGIGTYALAGREIASRPDDARRLQAPSTRKGTRTTPADRSRPFPSAAEFAVLFVEATNAYARDHGDPARVSHADCVQASPGRYMCSYESRSAGALRRCHLMQAAWTPDQQSTFTVTLAGRVPRCGSLREALRSLR